VNKLNGVGIVVCIAFLGGGLALAASNSPDKSDSKPQAESFQQPRTLPELLSLTPEQLEKVDLALMSLLCAEGLPGSESLDVQQCIATIGAWAGHVDRETKRNFHHFLEQPQEFKSSLPYYRMGMLGTVLAEDMRIKYNPEREEPLVKGPIEARSVQQWNTFFADSRDVFIHGLINGNHVGTCSSMPFLYASIARRLGYPVTVAARKYHLYLRYEGAHGEHLNVEATENLGFSTPGDEEYRNMVFPMTQEEIDGMGWLRPLSNREILGGCLLTRSICLRSAKRYDEQIKTLDAATRYLPGTALMKRVLEKNKQLARHLHSADRWDELWDELDKLLLPAGGPQAEIFQGRRLQLQTFMNQSTNLAEIEKSVSALKNDLRRYRSGISDDPARVAEAFGARQPAPNQQKFLALLNDTPGTRRIRIPQARVPPQYWNELPEELQKRLQNLDTEQEVVEEMNAYVAEEIGMRNLDARLALNGPRQSSPVDQRERTLLLESVRNRRSPLNQEIPTRPPLQIEIVPFPAQNPTNPSLSNLPQVSEPQAQVNAKPQQ
jgi:hypothetical protein